MPPTLSSLGRLLTREAGRRARPRGLTPCLPCGTGRWGTRTRGRGLRSRHGLWCRRAAAAAATLCRHGRRRPRCPPWREPACPSRTFQSSMFGTGWHALKVRGQGCSEGGRRRRQRQASAARRVSCLHLSACCPGPHRSGVGAPAWRRHLWARVPRALEPRPVRRQAAGAGEGGPLCCAVWRCAAQPVGSARLRCAVSGAGRPLMHECVRPGMVGSEPPVSFSERTPFTGCKG